MCLLFAKNYNFILSSYLDKSSFININARKIQAMPMRYNTLHADAQRFVYQIH